MAHFLTLLSTSRFEWARRPEGESALSQEKTHTFPLRAQVYKLSLIAVPSQKLPTNFGAIPIHHCAGLCSPPLTTHHQ